MSPRPPHPPSRKAATAIGRREAGAQIFALANLAIAQPLYDVLRKSPEFFIAHDSGWSDLAALILTLSVLPAAVLALVVWLAGRLGNGARTGVFLLCVALLCLLILLPIVKRTVDSSPAIPIAAVAAVVAAGLLYRLRFVRAVVTVLAALAVVFPLTFAMDPNVRTLVRSDLTEAGAAGGKIETPLVMVVLDQFPTAALLDDARQIRSDMFPNIARLAGGSHWFRNHTTVAQDTNTSVPAILTGMYPTGKLPPTLSSYPRNMFTLFRSAYELDLAEEVTQVGPSGSGSQRPALSLRIGPLLRDVVILFGHVVAPSTLAGRLPGIEDQVAFFGSNPASHGGFENEARAEKVADFLTRLDDRDGVFHYLHLLLPHGPYRFRPSGEVYTRHPRIPGLESAWGNWGDDPVPVDKARQRFLLQALLADRLVGQILDHMHAVGLYDKALFVVTSDHGASFRAGSHTRAATPTTHRDVLYVPLFIKPPFQAEGVVSDRNVETVDIFPTVAALLGADLPWPVEGESAFGAEPRKPNVKKAFCHRDGVAGLHEFPATDGGEFQQLDRMTVGLAFDARENWLRIESPNDHWLGAGVSRLKRGVPPVEATVSLMFEPSAGRDAKRDGFEFRAGWIQGHVDPAEGPDGDQFELAIAVDGRVVALTRTFVDGERGHVFAELLPESLGPLAPGRVEIVILRRVESPAPA